MLTDGRPSLQAKPVSQTRRKEASSVDELVSDFGFLTVNATSRDFHGFSETMSFAKLLRSIAVKQTIPTFTNAELPPRSAISHLVDHYFENVHVLLPFFSETEFMSSLSRVYQESVAVEISPFDMWCVRLVLAISSASMCQVRGDEYYNAALCHMGMAMQLAEYVLYPGSISGIQALLLLVQYAIVDPEYLDSWYIVGMASRLLVDLGLHSEPAPETRMSKSALDLRRRIFYCTYALDRLVSMSLGFAFSFTDDSAPNVLLPTLATDQEARSPSQLFIRSVRPSLYLFDIRRVQSAFYQRTRWSARTEWTADVASDFISSTLDDVHAWYASLPSSFTHKHLQGFYLESLYTQLLALSPNQVIPMNIISASHKVMFFQNAVQYSTHLRVMSQTAELQTSLCYADFCRARYVSRQFQNIMWANFDLMLKGEQAPGSPVQQSSPAENCNSALLFLSNMSQILEWPKQRWGISALQEIFEQESAVLLARLRARQQEYNAAQQPALSSNSIASYPQSAVSPTNHPGHLQGFSPTSQTGYAQQNALSIDSSGYNQQNVAIANGHTYRSPVVSPIQQSAIQQSEAVQNANNHSSYQQLNMSPTHQSAYPPAIDTSHTQLPYSQPPDQSFQPTFQPFQNHDYDAEALYSNHAMHRSNLLRSAAWPTNAEPNGMPPQGSLPRRTYEFGGGQR